MVEHIETFLMNFPSTASGLPFLRASRKAARLFSDRSRGDGEGALAAEHELGVGEQLAVMAPRPVEDHGSHACGGIALDDPESGEGDHQLGIAVERVQTHTKRLNAP